MSTTNSHLWESRKIKKVQAKISLNFRETSPMAVKKKAAKKKVAKKKTAKKSAKKRA